MPDQTPAKVLIVVNVDWFFWSHRLPVARGARDAGYHVVVVAAPEGGYADRIEREGFRFIPLQLNRGSLNPLREIGTMWALYRIYRAERPHLVHHVAVKPVLYGSLACRLARVPAVVNALAGQGWLSRAAGWRGRGLRALVRLGYRVALGGPRRRMIFQNPDDQRAFLEARLVRREESVLIRGSGVDPEQFRPAPETGGVPLIVFASRLLWSKGVGDVVQAARLLRAGGAVFRLALVGRPDPHNREAVREDQVQQWAESGVVEWWGQRDDMPDVMRQASIVTLPSVYGEGVPKVLIEAAAAGRAIVTTDIPGCREIVRHEQNGLLVPPGDAAALAGALRRLLDDPALRHRMGEAGRDLAMREFSVGEVVRQTLDVYRQLV